MPMLNAAPTKAHSRPTAKPRRKQCCLGKRRIGRSGCSGKIELNSQTTGR
jgi:hypothetical protein